jgi:hypothetical protein
MTPCRVLTPAKGTEPIRTIYSAPTGHPLHSLSFRLALPGPVPMAAGEITGLATREAATSSEDGPVAQLQEIVGRSMQGLTVLTGLLDNLAERVGRLESVQQRTLAEAD